MQLAGRILICLMFLTLLGEMSFNNLFTEFIRAVELMVGLFFIVSMIISGKSHEQFRLQNKS